MSDASQKKREQALRGRGFLDAVAGREPQLPAEPAYRAGYRHGKEAKAQGDPRRRDV